MLLVVTASIFVTSHCVSNCPETQWLKQPAFLHLFPLSVCGSGTQGGAELGASGSRTVTGCCHGVSRSCSQLKAPTGEGLLPSSLMWLLARFSSSWGVAQRTSAPVPCHRAEDRLPKGSSLLPEASGGRNRGRAQDGSRCLFVT